jgi:hypothetical protein
MIGTIRTSALAVSALVIAAAALAYDLGRSSAVLPVAAGDGRASCQPHQHQPTLTCAVR